MATFVGHMIAGVHLRSLNKIVDFYEHAHFLNVPMRATNLYDCYDNLSNL